MPHSMGKRGVTLTIANAKIRLVLRSRVRTLTPDIAGVVASMTEDDPGVLSEKLPTSPLG